MKKILILIGGHLSTSPRSQKEAYTLMNYGFDVVVAGIWSNPELVKFDKELIKDSKINFIPIVDFQPNKLYQNIRVRLKNKLAKVQYQKLNYINSNLLGYGTNEILKFALSYSADLTIAHSEGSMWVCKKLNELGYNVGIDLEDYFSEDLPLSVRKNRPIKILKDIENYLIKSCTYSLTTSHALASQFASDYSSRLPTVIYNSFPKFDKSLHNINYNDRKNINIPSIHWFSQTIGPERGLELLFNAIKDLKLPFEVHLRGNLTSKNKRWIEKLIPEYYKKLTFIHPLISNNELKYRIAEHDIGLALEIPYCKNKQLTVSNKILQYLNCGLAIIATNTLGQEEVFSYSTDIGYLVNPEYSSELKNAIIELIENNEKLEHCKNASLKLSNDVFSWENQEEKLISLVKQSLT